MSKRKIIKIDEDKCNGCGACITGCAEGALQLINGKAKLVKEQYCDGFGDCIGTCPTGALTIEERDADGFDFEATKSYLQSEHGTASVDNFEKAHQRHSAKETESVQQHAGCPGSRMMFNQEKQSKQSPATTGSPSQAIPSELNQWPVQIHLVPIDAPYFKNKELVVLSTCAPIASADVHWRFIRGRAVVVGCPKLDRTEGYADKLAAIFAGNSIPKVTVVRMEVPCCGGLTSIVQQAVELSGREDLEFEEVTIGVTGDVK